MNHAKARTRKRLPRPRSSVLRRDRAEIFLYSPHNVARRIRRPVVDRDHFIVVVIEREQRLQRLCNRLFLITGRNNNGDTRIAGGQNRIAIPFWTRNIGNAGHAKGSIHNAGNPCQGQNPSRNPIKVHHSKSSLLLRTHCRWQPAAQTSSHKTVSQTRSPSRSPAVQTPPAGIVCLPPIPSWSAKARHREYE